MKTTIKSWIVVAFLAAILAAPSCKQSVKEEEVTAEEQALTTQILKDSLEKLFAETLADIESNLDYVQQKQGVIIESSAAINESVSQRDRILNNIRSINSLMDENKVKIAKLNDQLKKFKGDNTRLNNLVVDAETKMRELDKQITLLKDDLQKKSFDLAELNKKVSDLDMKNQELKAQVTAYDKEANTAYYAYGTTKELKKVGVLEKQNAVERIVKKPAVKEGFAEDYFVRIDVREVKSIPIYAKKAKLLTDHPVSSYELKKEDGKITWLEIKDPEQFWKLTKYLVMSVKW